MEHLAQVEGTASERRDRIAELEAEAAAGGGPAPGRGLLRSLVSSVVTRPGNRMHSASIASLRSEVSPQTKILLGVEVITGVLITEGGCTKKQSCTHDACTKCLWGGFATKLQVQKKPRC